jgi:hypothetical protein
MFIAVIAGVVGWCLHMLWDWVADLLAATTGLAAGVVWDLLAVAGLIAVSVVIYQMAA